MMRHLTLADYQTQAWANGRGTTVQMMRVDKDGALLWRLSMASVVEDGPFSIFPNVDRNLTVIDGPGFRLVGDGLALNCAPLMPCAFPGDVAVRAEGTGGLASQDFNVMTARHLPRPQVTVERAGAVLPAGGLLALFALGPAVVNGQIMALHDLIITKDAATIAGASPVLCVRLLGL
jgi:uncharacterized protein